MNSLSSALSATTYPGRGIILGKNEKGQFVVAYFIMGRSVNSRNRVFETDGDGIRTRAFDESKMTDPSLVIYAPVRVIDDVLIVTNGDQTDTVFDFISSGKTFEDALRTRTFEPDAPNFTPRISGILEPDKNRFKLSVLKSDCGDSSSAQRFFYEYENPQNKNGFFVHTYQSDGDPLPSFEGEPEKVELVGDIDELTQNIWNSLNEENRVSLFVRVIDGKNVETRIVNKN